MATVTLYTTKDARVTQVFDGNYGTEARLWVGRGSGGQIDVTLVDFDLSSIPAHSVINSATLRFKQFDGSNDWLSPTISIAAKLVNQSWSETTVKWSTQPSTTGADSPLTSFANNISTNVDINVKDLVQTWVKNQGSYHGFQVRYTGTSSSTRKELRSREYGTQSHRPQLIIDYTSNTAPTRTGATIYPSTGLVSSTTSSIAVSWAGAFTDAQGDTLYYDVWRASSTGTVQIAASTTATSLVDNIGAGNEGATYQYSISCHDGVLWADKNILTGTITKNTKPKFPSGATVSTNPSGVFASTTNSVTVSWTAATDVNGQQITYEVTRTVGGGGASSITTTSTSWTDTGATGGAGTTYKYNVSARDTFNEYAPTSINSATITKNTVPTAPASVTLKTTGGSTLTGTIPENTSTIVVTWGAATDVNGHTIYYDIYRSVNGGTYTKINASSQTSLSYSDSIGAGNEGATYRYRVNARDSLQAGGSRESGILTKNVVTAPSLASIASISYSASTVNKSVSWTAASDTLGSTQSYKLSSSDITVQNSGATVSSGYNLPIYVSGAVPTTPYIKFSDLKTKFAGANYIGTFNITLTSTNAYGTSKTSTRSVSVNLQTNPTGLGTPSASGAIKIPVATGADYFIPNRQNITIAWTAATDPLGGTIKYAILASYNSKTYEVVKDNITSTSYSFALAEVSSATTAVFKVIASTTYNTTQESVSSSITLHYYRPPTIVINGITRNETSFTVSANISYNTSITDAAVRELSSLTHTDKAHTNGALTLTLTPIVTETITEDDKFAFKFFVQDVGGVACGTAIQSVTAQVAAYANMFSILENGVAINDTVPNVSDGVIFRVKGNVRIAPDINGKGQIISTLPTGTAPISVSSTTVCPNLNADLLDGYHAATFLPRLDNVNGVLVRNNWGAMYSATTTNTGYIVLDFGLDNMMFDAEISIRSYSYAGQVQISGYTYVSNTHWHHQRASGSLSSPLNVRFTTGGVDGKRYVLIGEPTTDWGSHLQVNVTRFSWSFGANNQSSLPISLTPTYQGVTTSSTHEIGTIWHSGNLAKSEFAAASHTHAYVPTARTVTAGNGLSGGGALSGNITLTLGTPGSLTNATTNAVTATSHTHAVSLTAANVGAAPASHSHDYAPTVGSVYYINRNSDGSCIQIAGPANVHVNRASGFYMAYNITNSPTADWWFYVYMKLDQNANTVFAFPCNSASTPRYKRFISGTWTSWANLNVSV